MSPPEDTSELDVPVTVEDAQDPAMSHGAASPTQVKGKSKKYMNKKKKDQSSDPQFPKKLSLRKSFTNLDAKQLGDAVLKLSMAGKLEMAEIASEILKTKTEATSKESSPDKSKSVKDLHKTVKEIPETYRGTHPDKLQEWKNKIEFAAKLHEYSDKEIITLMGLTTAHRAAAIVKRLESQNVTDPAVFWNELTKDVVNGVASYFDHLKPKDLDPRFMIEQAKVDATSYGAMFAELATDIRGACLIQILFSQYRTNNMIGTFTAKLSEGGPKTYDQIIDAFEKWAMHYVPKEAKEAKSEAMELQVFAGAHSGACEECGMSNHATKNCFKLKRRILEQAQKQGGNRKRKSNNQGQAAKKHRGNREYPNGADENKKPKLVRLDLTGHYSTSHWRRIPL